MLKIYTLQELRDKVNPNYFKLVNRLMAEIGGSSEEAIIKYTKEANYYFTEDGKMLKGV